MNTPFASQALWGIVTFLFLTQPMDSESRSSSDITANVFEGTSSDGIVAAFGDFNSDELTDVFVLSNHGRTLQVLLGYDVDPMLRPGADMKCEYKDVEVTSVVPGDFDGDAYMDLLVTTRRKGSTVLDIYVNWGESEKLNCSGEGKPLAQMIGEPVALDYNMDMIVDLFGMDTNSMRTYWVFNKERNPPKAIPMVLPHDITTKLKVPHSHAYVDLNRDFMADLFVTTEEDFEVWHGVNRPKHSVNSVEPFVFSHRVELPKGNYHKHVGQSLFLDFELSGELNQLLPICFDTKCQNSSLLIHSGKRFHDLQINFKDLSNNMWGFVPPEIDHLYLNAITLRGGDFNMDGYPDLLLTLKQHNGQPQTFLMENIPCKRNCGALTRTFEIQWRALSPFANGTVAGAFYDFYQDGILDVILVEQTLDRFRMVAFRNLLDYDANFVKCIVLTGLTNKRDKMKLTALGRKKRTYGKGWFLFIHSHRLFMRNSYKKTFSPRRHQSARSTHRILHHHASRSTAARHRRPNTAVRLLFVAAALHHFRPRSHSELCRQTNRWPCQRIAHMEATDTQLANDRRTVATGHAQRLEEPAVRNAQQADCEKCHRAQHHLCGHHVDHYCVVHQGEARGQCGTTAGGASFPF